jgi:hypothetical protein
MEFEESQREKQLAPFANDGCAAERSGGAKNMKAPAALSG